MSGNISVITANTTAALADLNGNPPNSGANLQVIQVEDGSITLACLAVCDMSYIHLEVRILHRQFIKTSAMPTSYILITWSLLTVDQSVPQFRQPGLRDADPDGRHLPQRLQHLHGPGHVGAAEHR